MERRNLPTLVAVLGTLIVLGSIGCKSLAAESTGLRHWHCDISAADSRISGNIDASQLNELLNGIAVDIESRDWDKLSDKIGYPLRVWDTNRSEFKELNQTEARRWLTTADLRFVGAALREGDCAKLRFTSDGVGVGDGKLWIASLPEQESAELRIVSIYPQK